MSVINVDAQMSPQQLLKAIEQLPTEELQAFANDVVALKVRRDMQSPSARESELLLRSNERLPGELQQRFDELVNKRQAGEITKAELGELIAITDRSERLEADRIEALAELATIRNTTVSHLMQEPEIGTPHGQAKD
jgi:hypothetical protein